MRYIPRNFAPPVQHLNGRGIADFLIARPFHLCDIHALLQHAERLAKRQIANDIECQVIEPIQGVQTVVLAFRDRSSAFVPLRLELCEVVVYILLELAN